MTEINQHTEEIFKTFKDVKAKYEVEKGWHMPWHFSQSGQYVCYLKGDLECGKDCESYDPVTEKEVWHYVVSKRR